MDDDSTEKIYKQLVSFGLDKHGFYGLIYSADNGANYKLLVGTQGRIFYPEDAQNFWPYLKAFVSSQINEAEIGWNNIIGKPNMTNYYTKSEVDNKIANAATGGQVDLSGYLTKQEASDKYATKQALQNIESQPGSPGKSAYEIAVAHGFTGTEEAWLRSLHGKDGTSGGNADLSIEVITRLINQHISAIINPDNGKLIVKVNDITDGSIADAIAEKVAQTIKLRLDNGNLIVQTGGGA